ncbi:MAG TPA: BBP7 family outer membrane beta-barrel protein [Pirellulales bacterium]|jgi:hypothetical protein
MIRVVVLLMGVALLPWMALAPVSAAPPKRVQDSYYLKRQQTKTETAPQDPSILEDEEEQGEAVPAGPSVPGIASGASFTPDMMRLPQAGNEGYDTSRQTVATPASAQPMHYANTNQDGYVSEEQVPSGQSGDSNDYNCDASDECEDGYGPMGLGCFAAAVNSVPTCNVLWNEIYSCRCMWTNFDYLGWWVKGNHVPPLVTTSPLSTTQTQAGVLGQPGTSILFGDQRLNNDLRSGGRVTVGGWLVGDVIGVEATYWSLATATTNFGAASNFSTGTGSNEIIARPYFNPAPPILTPPPPHAQLPPAQAAELIAYPSFSLPGGGTANLNGSVNVTSSSSVQSGGVLLRRLVGVDLVKDHRMFLVGGYRWFRLEEGLMVTDNVNVVGGGIPAGTSFSNLDSFGTRNQFNGGDIGLLSDLRRGRWVLETQGKIALGDMHESVNIDGQTKVTSGSSVIGYPGGVLTQVSNMGVFRRDQFAVIPELNIKLGFQITPGLRATAGYNFTYVSRVARPGNEVDFTVNPPYSPGAAQIVSRPTYLNNPTDLWLQGFTVGFDYRW